MSRARDMASSVSCEYHQYTTLLNSWVAWPLQSQTSEESGVKVMRMGPLYIVHINANNQTTSTGTFTSKILTLDSNITNPTNTVKCGTSFYGTGSQDDYVAHLEIEPDGDIQLYIYNPSGSGTHVAQNFIGLDTN